MPEVTRRNVSWNVMPWVHQDDYDFWLDWWQSDIWEGDTLDRIDEYVTPESTFIDCGAWIGATTLWGSRKAKQVVAVEADPVALEHLRHNVAANANNVIIVPSALADHMGTTFIEPHAEGWGSSMTHLATSGKKVHCYTLAGLFAAYDLTNVSLVKMDIEGAEAEVLPEGAPFLASQGAALLLSIHDHGIEKSWFNDFSTVIGEIRGWETILAIP